MGLWRGGSYVIASPGTCLRMKSCAHRAGRDLKFFASECLRDRESTFSVLIWILEPLSLFCVLCLPEKDFSMCTCLFASWLFPVVSDILGFPGGSIGKESALNPCVGKVSWRRKGQTTPAFLPGKSYGQRSLMGCSPWGHKELHMP